MNTDDRIKVNPGLQEILDEDTALHNFLLQLAEESPPSHRDQEVFYAQQQNRILAAGLSALHSRLGQMWRWDKAVDPG